MSMNLSGFDADNVVEAPRQRPRKGQPAVQLEIEPARGLDGKAGRHDVVRIEPEGLLVERQRPPHREGQLELSRGCWRRRETQCDSDESETDPLARPGYDDSVNHDNECSPRVLEVGGEPHAWT